MEFGHAPFLGCRASSQQAKNLLTRSPKVMLDDIPTVAVRLKARTGNNTLRKGKNARD